jgi:hypothetical protein
MKHTELPWEYTSSGVFFSKEAKEFVQILSPWSGGVWKENKQATANAEFIVKAVNNHYQLLNAAKYAFDTFRAFQQCNMTSLGMDQAIDDLGKAIKQAEES